VFIQVAERAHLLWNNEHILNLITQNRQVILPLVFSALVHNSQNHWNQAVLNLTQNIKKMLSQMDEELVLACQRKIEEEDSKSSDVAERRRITWERLEEAATNIQSVGSGNGNSGSSSSSSSDILVQVTSATATCSVAC
jgi:serine/threonine-protein phosphatase 2A regulatory subunit B'